MQEFIKQIRSELRESASVKQNFSDELLGRVARFAEMGGVALKHGRKIIFFGNGGSAADAQHLAAELVVRLQRNRAGLAAISLATNASILTAAGNDFGFENIFARQIESLASEGDVVVALSTSGKSPNVLRGAEAGRARRAVVVGMTGEAGGELASKVDLLIDVPSRNAQRIQEAHITIGHIVCGLIEQICCG
ncbi:MAG TPA: SIS domain-containing protein [Candidatus Acidoferrales bacterium]|nr:SIS domain-containing protein [Candidatus Acidoferrales bacterium]